MFSQSTHIYVSILGSSDFVFTTQYVSRVFATMQVQGHVQFRGGVAQVVLQNPSQIPLKPLSKPYRILSYTV